jgi:SAM-dependent methyltransferase
MFDAAMSSEDITRLREAQLERFDDDIPFWIGLAETIGSPILELGCGTGRVMIPLLLAGFSVDGLDSNPAALDRLSSRMNVHNLNAGELHRGRMQEFCVERFYNLIISPCNTFSTLSESDATKTLKNIGRHLKPNGTLVMDLPNPGYILDNDSQDEGVLTDSFIEPKTGNACQVFTRQRYDLESERMSVTWTYDELHPDGEVVRHEMTLNHYLRTPAQMEEILFATGFSSVLVYGDYDLSQYQPDAAHMLVRGTHAS